jgi:uncharacterized protein (DUF433 family)
MRGEDGGEPGRSRKMALRIEAEPVPLVSDADGRLHVSGTRVTLDTVVAAFGDGATAEEIVQRDPSLRLGDVYAILTFYIRRRPDVDAYLCQPRRETEAVRGENEKRFDPRGIRKRLLTRRVEVRA